MKKYSQLLLGFAVILVGLLGISSQAHAVTH